MSNLTLFIVGFLIFFSYMFFLLRMIRRQHAIQKNTLEQNAFKLRKIEDDRMAS